MCVCRSHFTVEICHVQVLQMSDKTVLLKGCVRLDGLACRDVFSGTDFRPMRCAHDIDINIMARITMDQWDHVAGRTSRFIIVNGLLQTGVLDNFISVSCDDFSWLKN